MILSIFHYNTKIGGKKIKSDIKAYLINKLWIPQKIFKNHFMNIIISKLVGQVKYKLDFCYYHMVAPC